MDRLEKIKGYADRAPKDDVLWLIGEVEKARGDARHANKARRDVQERLVKMSAELAALKGDLPAPRCPCLHPADHAGWCPRR